MAATNASGQSPVAPALGGVFGPQGVVAGQVVQSFHLADDKRFDIEAPGAVITLTDSANPAAPPRSANADDGGHFRIRHVPPGVYLVQYLWQGRIGVLPEALNVPAGGAALSPLEIHTGPEGPAPDKTLIGYLFPVTLTGCYRGLGIQRSIDAPPAVLAPVSLQFETPMPKTHRITAWQNGGCQ